MRKCYDLWSDYDSPTPAAFESIFGTHRAGKDDPYPGEGTAAVPEFLPNWRRGRRSFLGLLVVHKAGRQILQQSLNLWSSHLQKTATFSQSERIRRLLNR